MTKHHILFVMKIPNKREFQQIAINHLLDTHSKDFIKISKISQRKQILSQLMIRLYQFYTLDIRHEKQY